MDNSHKTDEALPVQSISYLDVTYESPSERTYRLAIGWFAIVYACLMTISVLTRFAIDYNLLPPHGKERKLPLDAYQNFGLCYWLVINILLVWGGIMFLRMSKSGVNILRLACVIWIAFDIVNDIYLAYNYPIVREAWMSISGFIHNFTEFFLLMICLPALILVLLHPRAVIRFR